MKTKEEKKVLINFTIDLDLKKEFDCIARKKCINKSMLMCDLLINWIEENKKIN